MNASTTFEAIRQFSPRKTIVWKASLLRISTVGGYLDICSDEHERCEGDLPVSLVSWGLSPPCACLDEATALLTDIDRLQSLMDEKESDVICRGLEVSELGSRHVIVDDSGS